MNLTCKDCTHFNVCHKVEACGSSFLEDATKCKDFIFTRNCKDVYYSKRLLKHIMQKDLDNDTHILLEGKYIHQKEHQHMFDVIERSPGVCLHDIRIEAVRDFVDLLETYYEDMYDVAGPAYDGRFVHEDELRRAVREFMAKEYNKS